MSFIRFDGESVVERKRNPCFDIVYNKLKYLRRYKMNLFWYCKRYHYYAQRLSNPTCITLEEVLSNRNRKNRLIVKTIVH